MVAVAPSPVPTTLVIPQSCGIASKVTVSIEPLGIPHLIRCWASPLGKDVKPITQGRPIDGDRRKFEIFTSWVFPNLGSRGSM